MYSIPKTLWVSLRPTLVAASNNQLSSCLRIRARILIVDPSYAHKTAKWHFFEANARPVVCRSLSCVVKKLKYGPGWAGEVGGWGSGEPSVDLLPRRAGGGEEGEVCKQYVTVCSARSVRCVAVKLKLGELCLGRNTDRSCSLKGWGVWRRRGRAGDELDVCGEAVDSE